MCHYWWPFYNTYWCKEICDWLQLGATVNLPNRIPYLASSSCRLNDSSLWSKSEQSVYENKYSDENLMISSYLVVLQDNLSLQFTFWVRLELSIKNPCPLFWLAIHVLLQTQQTWKHFCRCKCGMTAKCKLLWRIITATKTHALIGQLPICYFLSGYTMEKLARA